MMNSSQHVLAGIACLEKQEWRKALGHFDRAIAVREVSDWQGETSAAWGLAAAYINRSDALRLLGDFPEAISSLHMAIRTMEHVPLAEHPAYPERLILAWINLATAFEESEQTDSAEEAFSKASSLLETWGNQTSPTRTFLAAMLHTNRARFFVTTRNSVAAWTDAGQAILLLDSLDPVEEVISASIRARGILCQSLALILDTPDGIALEADWIARATDAAEEALELARSSKYQGQWIASLVHYCAKIYRICQPHFLGEFLRESFAPGSPLIMQQNFIREMGNELLLARAELETRVMTNPHDTDLVRKETETLRKLQLAEIHLRSFNTTSSQPAAAVTAILQNT